MPNCIQFFRKDDPSNKAVKLPDVDKHICEVLKVPCHKIDWYLNWFNLIGPALATGKTYDEIAKHLEDDPQLLAVVGVLRDHYGFSAWFER